MQKVHIILWLFTFLRMLLKVLIIFSIIFHKRKMFIGYKFLCSLYKLYYTSEEQDV